MRRAAGVIDLGMAEAVLKSNLLRSILCGSTLVTNSSSSSSSRRLRRLGKRAADDGRETVGGETGQIA